MVNHTDLLDYVKKSINKFIDNSLKCEWYSEFSYNSKADIVFTTKNYSASTVAGVTQLPMQLVIDVINKKPTLDDYDNLPMQIFDSLSMYQASAYGNESEFDLIAKYDEYLSTGTPEHKELKNHIKMMISTPMVGATFTPDGVNERTILYMDFNFVIIDSAVLFGDNKVYFDNVELLGCFDISMSYGKSYNPYVLGLADSKELQKTKLSASSETYIFNINFIKENALHLKLKRERTQNKEYTIKIYDGTFNYDDPIYNNDNKIIGYNGYYETFKVKLSNYTESNTLGGVKTAQISVIRS